MLDQQVYVVNFDDQGVVKAVDHKDLEDGKEISAGARATPAPGRELTFLEQLIGNLGSFNGSGGGSGERRRRRRGQPRGPTRTSGKHCSTAACGQLAQLAPRIASSSSATMLVILIIGLTAGPAVSL